MATQKSTQMAVLKIGLLEYVMPVSKALKAIELFSGAMEVDSDYGDSYKLFYTVKTHADVSVSVIQSDQLRMPNGEPTPVRRGRTRSPALTNEILKLEG